MPPKRSLDIGRHGKKTKRSRLEREFETQSDTEERLRSDQAPEETVSCQETNEEHQSPSTKTECLKHSRSLESEPKQNERKDCENHALNRSPKTESQMQLHFKMYRKRNDLSKLDESDTESKDGFNLNDEKFMKEETFPSAGSKEEKTENDVSN